MAQLIDLKTFTDNRGNLTVIEKVIPFDIKRIFYIYGVDDWDGYCKLVGYDRLFKLRQLENKFQRYGEVR